MSSLSYKKHFLHKFTIIISMFFLFTAHMFSFGYYFPYSVIYTAILYSVIIFVLSYVLIYIISCILQIKIVLKPKKQMLKQIVKKSYASINIKTFQRKQFIDSKILWNLLVNLQLVAIDASFLLGKEVEIYHNTFPMNFSSGL